MKSKEIKEDIESIDKLLSKPLVEKAGNKVRLNRMSGLMRENIEKRRRELMLEYLYYKSVEVKK